jgi:DNA transformation protein
MMKKLVSPSAISGLKFLGPMSEKVVAEAGIKSVAQLRKLGSVVAYLQAKRVNPNVSLNLLWALEAALSGKHWREVARDDRTSLLLAVETMQGSHRSSVPRLRKSGRPKLKTGN